MVKDSIFFVSPDPDRAVWMHEVIEHPFLITAQNKPSVEFLKAKGVNVFSIAETEDGFVNNSGAILALPRVRDYIRAHAGRNRPLVMYFKPSAKIDKLCSDLGYTQIGNRATLAAEFEDKIAFYRLCTSLSIPTPPCIVGVMASLEYTSLAESLGTPFILQFGRGWAGSTTFRISTAADFALLATKYAKRIAKASKLVKGWTFTNNACISSAGDVLVSALGLQIPPFEVDCRLPFATHGRQWPVEVVGEGVASEALSLTRKIGVFMANRGYRGWFGLDFLFDQEKGDLFVSENNARLTASFPVFTTMEVKAGAGVTLVESHIRSFLGSARPEWKSSQFCLSEIVLRNESLADMYVSGQRIPPGEDYATLDEERIAVDSTGQFCPWLFAAVSKLKTNLNVN